ncbi:MAG: patatin-like phospholipase family protein, partial [Burkholderiaceae bacterium]
MSDEIDGMVKQRRAALGGDPDDPGKRGLALSGGGIRSATFCFGLLAALSRNRLLERFDLLSTVSGGGYIGAMLGRLLSRATTWDKVREVLAAVGDRKSRWFHWWLRANGRYLIPRGAADRLFAATIYLRNLVAIHLELGVVGLLLGVVLVGMDVVGWSLLAGGLSACAPGGGGISLVCEGTEGAAGVAFKAVRWLSPWLPTPWVLLVILIPLAAFNATAYWVVPWVARARLTALLGWWALLLATASVLAFFGADLIAFGMEGHWTRGFLLALTVVLVAAWLLAIPLGWLMLHQAHQRGVSAAREEWVRRSLTDRLVWLGTLGGVFVLLG